MAERILKIKLPTSPEKRQAIIEFLEKHNLISKEQVSQLKRSSPSTKNKWALLADRFRSDKEGHLNGISDKAKEYIQEFRDSFQI